MTFTPQMETFAPGDRVVAINTIQVPLYPADDSSQHPFLLPDDPLRRDRVYYVEAVEPLRDCTQGVFLTCMRVLYGSRSISWHHSRFRKVKEAGHPPISDRCPQAAKRLQRKSSLSIKFANSIPQSESRSEDPNFRREKCPNHPLVVVRQQEDYLSFAICSPCVFDSLFQPDSVAHWPHPFREPTPLAPPCSNLGFLPRRILEGYFAIDLADVNAVLRGDKNERTPSKRLKKFVIRCNDRLDLNTLFAITAVRNTNHELPPVYWVTILIKNIIVVDLALDRTICHVPCSYHGLEKIDFYPVQIKFLHDMLIWFTLELAWTQVRAQHLAGFLYPEKLESPVNGRPARQIGLWKAPVWTSEELPLGRDSASQLS